VEDNHYLQCLNWWAVQSCDTEMQYGFLYMLGPSFWELGNQTWLECGINPLVWRDDWQRECFEGAKLILSLRVNTMLQYFGLY